MDRSDVCYLISKSVSGRDAYGRQTKSEEVRKQVFCNVRTATHKEKVENGIEGVQNAFTLSVFKYDYSGESTVEYNGKRYAVYDAPEFNDLVRLYIQEEKGI